MAPITIDLLFERVVGVPKEQPVRTKPFTLTEAGEVLKTVWLPAVREALDTPSPLLSHLEK